MSVSVTSLSNKNLYLYCNDNPMYYSDKSGYIPMPVLQGIIGAVTNFTISAVSAIVSGQEFSALDGIVALATGAVATFKYDWVNFAVAVTSGMYETIMSLYSGESLGLSLMKGGIAALSSIGMISTLEKLGKFKIEEKLLINVVDTIYSFATNSIASVSTRVISELSNSKSSNKPARIFTNVKVARVGSNSVVRSVYGGTARYVI